VTSYDAPGVRHSRQHRTRSSVRSGSSAAASVRQATKPSGQTNNAPSVSRGDARRPPPPLQHLPAPHRSDIHTSSGTPSRCITRSAAVRSTPRHWPRQASSTKRGPYRSRWWKNLPAAEGDFYVRSPGTTRLARYSSLGSNDEMCPPTRRVRPTSGIPVAHRYRPIVDEWGTSSYLDPCGSRTGQRPAAAYSEQSDRVPFIVIEVSNSAGPAGPWSTAATASRPGCGRPGLRGVAAEPTGQRVDDTSRVACKENTRPAGRHGTAARDLGTDVEP
jgi:hypothetical protein